MKTLLKIVIALVALIVIALIVTPMIFKDDIVKMVKEETNNTVNAKVEFGDFNLSLIQSFPNFYFAIENIKVSGVNEFEGVDLAAITEIDLTVDLMSVINGESIAVKSINIVEPKIHAKVLENAKANWDIAKPSTDEDSTVVTEESSEAAADFKVELKRIEIVDAQIIYEDATLPMLMDVNDLDLVISGDLTQSVTTINADGGVSAFDLTFDGVKYMNAAKISLAAAMEANMDEFKFTFKENEIKVNELPLGFDGWVAMPNDPIDMDFTFFAKETDFKDILSMVPAEFAKDLEGVKTSGTVALDGYAKGTFIDSTYPAFGAKMMVENASFSYPDLPKSVTDIQIMAAVDNADGDLNSTIVDVPKFHLKMADNPFDFNFYLATPMSDPFIKAGLNGTLVLDNIADVIPLEEGDELSGTIISNMSMEGNMSTIENERYEDFQAGGELKMTDFKFTTAALDYAIDIQNAEMAFSPAFVSLDAFDMQLGKSDLSANGRLENFIGYALVKGQTLKGQLDINSNLMDINELAGMEEEEASAEASSSDSTVAEEPLEVVVLPDHIDFTTNANIKKLTFDDIVIENINGGIVLKEQKLSLSQTSMNLLDGAMIMDGFYETTDSTKPSFDFGMDIKNFDVQATILTFNSVKQMVPIAEKTTGKYSTYFEVQGDLNAQMEPDYESLFGKGKLNTQNIEIKDYEPLKKIAETIKYNQLNPMGINDVAISFEIVEGKVYVEPFTNKIGNSTVTIAGSNSFDQTIDYLFSFAIPRKEFGGAANAAIDGLLAQASNKGVDLKMAETINVDVRLSGPASDPKISTDFKKTKSDATQAIKDKAKEEFDKKKKELEDQAKKELEKKKKEAEAEAKKLLDEQKKKAQDELEKQKKEAQKKLQDEAKKKLKGLFGK